MSKLNNNLCSPGYVDTFQITMQCIIEAMKTPQLADYIIENLGTMHEIQYTLVKPSTSGSVINVRKKPSSTTGLKLSRTHSSAAVASKPRASVNTPSRSITSESNKDQEEDLKANEQTARLSFSQILIYLYSYITEENVERLIRITVRLINSINKHSRGSEMLLTELQRIDRTSRKSNYLGNQSNDKQLSKSEGSTKMALRTTEPVLKVHGECQFLLPLISPIKNSNGNFDVSLLFF